MTEAEAVPQNGPWPKDFPELKELDDLLKCSICYEYMKTSLIGACSHSFCSICIRKYLQYENQCPSCFSPLFDNQLRNNRTLDSVIQVYTQVKEKLSHHLRISAVVIPSTSSKDTSTLSQNVSVKRDEPKKFQVKAVVSHSEEPGGSKPKKRQTISNPDKASKRETNNKSNDLDAIEVIETITSPDPPPSMKAVAPSPCLSLASPSVSKIRVPDMFTSSPKSHCSSTSSAVPQNTLPCPVCSVEIPEANINLHLDKCLLRASGQQPPPEPKIQNKMKRLPKLVYTLLSDKDLKKKAKEYGLNNVGERKTLISRLKRYTVIYNSECDKNYPRSLSEILQQVEKEEKLEQKANAQVEKPTSIFNNITRNTDLKVIDQVNDKYIKENEQTFKMLIAKMKEREGQNIRPTGHVNRIFDDEEPSEPEILLDHTETTSTPNHKHSLNQTVLPDCLEAGSTPNHRQKSSLHILSQSTEGKSTPSRKQNLNPQVLLDRSETKSALACQRSILSRVNEQLFEDSDSPYSDSPILLNKTVNHRDLPSSNGRTDPSGLLDVSIRDSPRNHTNSRLDDSSESFSILDDSQLDFSLDNDPIAEGDFLESSVKPLPETLDDDNSVESVEIFVPSRSRKRKEMEPASTRDTSANPKRRLRKRVER